ncbi:hypothetical protein KV205_30260 [Streptomyces sp. SKN60]|nr:hypothetical protein [Streptomyces sp. SKN60]MCX2184781.1 hypothetical protein [Streptomyces sp. SKN60]
MQNALAAIAHRADETVAVIAGQALSRRYDLVLVADGHTTSVREPGSGPYAAPDASVAHHNESFRHLDFPGRSVRVLAAADVDFSPPPAKETQTY